MRGASTPVRAVWLINNKRRSSELDEQDVPPCKSVPFDLAGKSGGVGGRDLSRNFVTDASESVSKSLITSGGLSILEGFARQQIDERVVGFREDVEGESMMRLLPADELLGQKDVRKEMARYYLSQSAKSMLKQYSELNPANHADANHPTTNFSAYQMIYFAHTVGLGLSLASYSMLEDLLMKARVGNVGQNVTLRYPTEKSSVAGSTMRDSVASQSVFSYPLLLKLKIVILLLAGMCFKSRVLEGKLTLGSLKNTH